MLRFLPPHNPPRLGPRLLRDRRLPGPRGSSPSPATPATPRPPASPRAPSSPGYCGELLAGTRVPGPQRAEPDCSSPPTMRASGSRSHRGRAAGGWAARRLCPLSAPARREEGRGGACGHRLPTGGGTWDASALRRTQHPPQGPGSRTLHHPLVHLTRPGVDPHVSRAGAVPPDFSSHTPFRSDLLLASLGVKPARSVLLPSE